MNVMFWKDNTKHRHGYDFTGGYYFRSFDLNKFVKQVQDKQGEVVGLRIVENNIEIIVQKYGQNDDTTPT